MYLHYFGIPYAFNGGVTPPGCPAGAKNGEDDVSVYFRVHILILIWNFADSGALSYGEEGY